MTAGIVLAAGGSRRFGRAKQLAHLAGEPLVRRACQTALAAGLDPVVVVLGAHAAEVARALEDMPVTRVDNPDWAAGLSTSIRCGIQSVSAHPTIAAAAIVLADQPLIDPAHLRALCDARVHERALVAATRYGDVLGVPAVFDRALFAALSALTGDRGAGPLIAQTERRVVLEFAAAAVDIDTPDDLEAAR